MFKYSNEEDLTIRIIDFGFAFFYDPEEAVNME